MDETNYLSLVQSHCSVHTVKTKTKLKTRTIQVYPNCKRRMKL